MFVIFVKADSHNSVSLVEGLFDSITMVNIDIEVEYSWIDFEQLQYAKDYIIDIAKSARFSFFTMMKPARPVYNHVTFSRDYQIRCINAASCCQLAEIKQAFEPRAIKSLIYLEDRPQTLVFSHPLMLLFLVKSVRLYYVFSFRRYPGFQILDVVGMMKGGHFFRCSLFRVVHFEVRSEVVVVDEAVDHLNAPGLHRVFLAELILSDVLVVEVAHLLHSQYDYKLFSFASVKRLSQSIPCLVRLITISYTLMMKTGELVLLLLLLGEVASNRCSNNSQCFLTKLFDFSYPQEGVYNISLGSNTDNMNNAIRSLGDFNNDLRTDYLATDANGNTLVYLYNITEGQYQLKSTLPPFQGCVPINYYLYDTNGDSWLDITVWGIVSGSGNNCLYPYTQTNLVFTPGTANIEQYPSTISSSQPSLFEMNIDFTGNQIRTPCLLIFNTNTNLRTIGYLNGNTYEFKSWETYFYSQPSRSNLPFTSPHWNTFVDLTNDCYPDFIITGESGIEFWIYSSVNRQFILFVTTVPAIVGSLTALNMVDLDYDGAQDLVIANQTHLIIYKNNINLDSSSEFCVSKSQSFSFNFISPIYFSPNCPLNSQNLQFTDLNIDGYPELMLICSSNNVMVYQNKFNDQATFSAFDNYMKTMRDVVNSLNKPILSASFFDILQNGIIDIIVVIDGENYPYTLAIYNNYLYQNSFYIKGYGTNGKNTSLGTQVPGLSFYWRNSVGNSQKITYISQITQTAYNAMPMPYVVAGLGRANNYVEAFTMGRLGQSKSWSPIIPNSQLAIFSGSTDSQNWAIKIFIMPTDSLVYVIIVCIVILAFLGIVLLVLKCRNKKVEEPLLPDM